MAKLIDVAREKEEKYGIDPDEIMLLDRSDIEKMYPSLVEDDPPYYLLESLKSEVFSLKEDLKTVNANIKELELDEIPLLESAINEKIRDDQLSELRSDLSNARRNLNRYLEKRAKLLRAIDSIIEKIRKLDVSGTMLYDDPDSYEILMLEIDLSEINEKLDSIYTEIDENGKMLLKTSNRYEKNKILSKTHMLEVERDNLINRKNSIEIRLEELGQRSR